MPSLQGAICAAKSPIRPATFELSFQKTRESQAWTIREIEHLDVLNLVVEQMVAEYPDACWISGHVASLIKK